MGEISSAVFTSNTKKLTMRVKITLFGKYEFSNICALTK